MQIIALGIAAASSDGQKQGFARSFLPIGDIAESPACKEMPKYPNAKNVLNIVNRALNEI